MNLLITGGVARATNAMVTYSSAAGITTYYITKRVGQQHHRAEVRVPADKAASWSADEQIDHIVTQAAAAFTKLREREAAAAKAAAAKKAAEAKGTTTATT